MTLNFTRYNAAAILCREYIRGARGGLGPQRDVLVEAFREAVRCRRCGRELEDEQSKKDGYGRDCMAKIARAAS